MDNTIKEVTLPNGSNVFCRSEEEIKFLYDEIFEKKMYFKHGISLTDGSTVIDAGANIGMFTMFIQHNYKDCKIYSIEPIPQTYEVLAKNVEKNSNIKALNVGISDKIGEAQFAYFPTISTDSVQVKYRENHEEDLRYGLLNHYKDSIDDEVKLNRFVKHVMSSKVMHETIINCKLTTISDIMKNHNIDSVDLLKIDVEKSEFEALAGIAQEDWAKIRQVVMEVHGLGEKELNQLRDIFHSHEFDVEIDLYEELNVPKYFNVYAKHR